MSVDDLQNLTTEARTVEFQQILSCLKLLLDMR
jgi:hypothetical protein